MRASAAAVVGVLVVALGASGGSALAGDFVVYLDPDYRPAEYWKGTRWPQPHGVSRDWILAGRVTLSSSWAPNLVRADAELAVPEVAPGKYTAILCDRGCTTPLGDVSPSDVRVVRSATVAHVRPALMRLRSELRSEVEALEGNVSHTRSEQAAESYAVETELQELRTDVRRMAAELIAQRERRDLWSYAAWFAAGAAAVFAVALVSSRRRWRGGGGARRGVPPRGAAATSRLPGPSIALRRDVASVAARVDTITSSSR